MMDNQGNNGEASPYHSQTKEDKTLDLTPIQAADWTKVVGKTLVSKEGLDMGKIIVDGDTDYRTSYSISIEYGDPERFSIPKDTIYKFDQNSLYTTLTENETLASRKNDPFSTSVRSYTRD